MIAGDREEAIFQIDFEQEEKTTKLLNQEEAEEERPEASEGDRDDDRHRERS